MVVRELKIVEIRIGVGFFYMGDELGDV